ncbi:unnamed protein product [Ectocarpus sp. 4 AP-2014]
MAFEDAAAGKGGDVDVDHEATTAAAGSSDDDTNAKATAGGIGPTATFRCVSCADEMNPSWRNSMEDAHETVAHFDGDPSTSFFAVYDGHGGRGTVDFVSSRLEEILAEEMRADNTSSIQERITRAYGLTDCLCKEASVLTSGATAVTCLLREQDGKVTIHAANIGDSRAVLARGGKAERLTYDHKAEDAAEQERVNAAGGFVLRNRVLGILAVSRSFGNQGMKDLVTAVPHVSETSVCPDCTFLILACDGVWDVFTDNDAVSFVTQAMETMAEADVAGALLRESLARGSTDNITVVIVFF